MMQKQIANKRGYFLVNVNPSRELYFAHSSLRFRRVSTTRVRAFFLDGPIFFMDFKEDGFAF